MISQTELAISIMFRRQIEEMQSLHREHDERLISRLESGDTIQTGIHAAVVIDGRLVIDMHAHACDHDGVNAQET